MRRRFFHFEIFNDAIVLEGNRDPVEDLAQDP